MSEILVLCPYVPHPPNHGGSIRSRVLLEALAKDHVVHVAAAMATDADRANADALGAAFGLTIQPIPAHAAPRAHLAQKLHHWLRGHSELLARRWAPGAAAAVAELAARRPFDLVVADSSFVLPVLPRGPAPLLLHLHNLESSVIGRRDGVARGFGERTTRRIEGARMAADERTALRRAALTVTVSELDRMAALAMAPDANVHCVPNSVDVDSMPLQPPPDAGPVRLLFVGTLDYPPNLEAATELVERHLPALRTSFPGLCVRLVGRDDGGHGARFQGLAGVERVGPAADLAPHYRASHAVYLPIRSGGGTRIKILEAWAFGRPVLATTIAAEGLGGAEGPVCRRFETVEQGVAALREVLAGDGPALVAAGRAFVERQHSHRAAILRLRELVGTLLPR
jgi:glycosyltransferase involved in cell wall biosynthesis